MRLLLLISSGSDSGFCHHDKKTCSRCSTDEDGNHAQDLTELLESHQTKVEAKPRGRRPIGKYKRILKKIA